MGNFIKIKQNKGITGVDLAISICVIVIFVGLISSLFYNIYSHSTAVRLNALAVDYAIKIAEETDILNYEDVDNNLNDTLRSKFDIPDAYNTSISVEKYSDIDFKLIITFTNQNKIREKYFYTYNYRQNSI